MRLIELLCVMGLALKTSNELVMGLWYLKLSCEEENVADSKDFMAWMTWFRNKDIHRLYALEVKKTVDMASKLSQENLTWSFRRASRSGVEQDQLTDLMTYVEGVVLVFLPDRWYWTLDGSGEFSVASARKVIDDNRFPEVSTQTRWIKVVPIKVNIHAWKVRMDCLPTRLNISRRDNFRKICRWWEVDFME
ncbi:hypothetical protein Tco_1003358 [Tanacetum coccineum]|uniref:RNA-directed DNA polymerase, eukaryota n=1 Tax=Tanacetum coccineum TaxID=301880 RepID=A0ABQ5F984_9ASTR